MSNLALTTSLLHYTGKQWLQQADSSASLSGLSDPHYGVFPVETLWPAGGWSFIAKSELHEVTYLVLEQKIYARSRHYYQTGHWL